MTIAVDIRKENGVKQAYALGKHVFDMCFFDCHDVQYAIKVLITKKNPAFFAACLQKPDEEAFALLYGFVEAFVISGYDDLNEDIDPLINLRMYNDDYKEIYLRIPDNFLYEELDEVLAYSMLSNIDGVVISNPRLLRHAVEKTNGTMKIIASNIDTRDKFEKAKEDGADIAAVPFNNKFACSISGRLALRKIQKN